MYLQQAIQPHRLFAQSSGGGEAKPIQEVPILLSYVQAATKAMLRIHHARFGKVMLAVWSEDFPTEIDHHIERIGCGLRPARCSRKVHRSDA
jgi:hypothetical protein